MEGSATACPSFYTMNTRFNITIGLLFILAGFLVGSDQIIQFVQTSYAQPVSQPVSSQEIAQTIPVDVALPIHLSVPSSGVSVDIDPGYYSPDTQTWTISDTKAYFAVGTATPNTVGGNTYIYGHNRGNIFYRLNKALPGAEAVVTTSDNKKFTYILTTVRDVQPSDMALLNYQGEPILTLQTCSGLWDQYRRLFIFNLVSAN